jgi:hypothetical protein
VVNPGLRRFCLPVCLLAAAAQLAQAQTPASSPAVGTSHQPSDNAARRATAALDKLDAWLGNNPNGDRWRQYLQTAQLRAELQRGADADLAAVSAALRRVSGNANGLNLAPFATVREALRAWLSELRQGYAGDLSKLALASRGDHEPITADQFARVRAAMRNKAQALLQSLGGNTQLARNWQTYLKWNQLQPHLADNFQVTNRSLADLDEVLQRLRANQPGLELPVFVNLAKAIAKYRALASWTRAVRSRDAAADYARLLDNIAAALDRHRERPTSETAWRVGRVLGIIDSLGQAPDLVMAIRKQYARPNIEAIVSTNFLQRAPNRGINQVRPVRDCILGTTIIGTACTLGDVQYALQPSENSIAMAIYLDGHAQSRTNGYNGPVRIHTTGVTTYTAASQLYLSDDQFTATPVIANVDTHTQIRSINKTGGQFAHRLIEKIAWKRALEQKRQSELISAQHTKQRVVREFTDTVSRDLARLRQRYERQVTAPMVRRGVVPEYLHMHSNPSAAFIETILASRNQLGADRAAPKPTPGFDLGVQVHESAVNNYLVLALASARISQETAENPPQLTGDIPNWIKVLAVARPKLAAAAATGAQIVEEAQKKIEEAVKGEIDERKPSERKAPPFKPYSITLNSEAPVGVRFDDGKLTVRIRASRLVSDDAEYSNWDFIVAYQITTDGDRIKLKRVGDIEVFPTGFDPAWDKQLTAQQSGFRSTLAKNMNARANSGQGFPAEIPIEPVRISQFGALLLHELTADDGWLTVSWILPPGAAETAPPKLEPATSTRAAASLAQPRRTPG